MPCGCNGICGGNYCPGNAPCYGNEAVCSNSFNFTANPVNPVSAGVDVEAQHLADLETAINNERIDASRRYNANPTCLPDSAVAACAVNDWAAYNFAANSGVRATGDLIKALHINNVVSANDQVESDSGFGVNSAVSVSVGGTIQASELTQLQTDINGTRNACICNSHVSCNPHCCNIYCPADDPGYPGIG